MNDAIPTDDELKKRATVLYEIALELQNNGKSFEAIAYLSAALWCAPNCTEILNLLLTKRGIIFRVMTNFEVSMFYFLNAQSIYYIFARIPSELFFF